MKYIIAIALGTIVIGSLLSFGAYFLFGENFGYFFVKFIAVLVGAISSLILFVVYDTLWPKK